MPRVSATSVRVFWIIAASWARGALSPRASSSPTMTSVLCSNQLRRRGSSDWPSWRQRRRREGLGSSSALAATTSERAASPPRFQRAAPIPAYRRPRPSEHSRCRSSPLRAEARKLPRGAPAGGGAHRPELAAPAKKRPSWPPCQPSIRPPSSQAGHPHSIDEGTSWRLTRGARGSVGAGGAVGMRGRSDGHPVPRRRWRLGRCDEGSWRGRGPASGRRDRARCLRSAEGRSRRTRSRR